MELSEFIATLTDFLASDVDQLWIVDERVHYDGRWESFQAFFDDCEADLLATEVRTREEEPGWCWWTSLKSGQEAVPAVHGVAALLPLIRINRNSAEAILRGIGEGWTGHPEALVPTLVSRAGLKIEDIGGNSSFTPQDRKGRWYDQRTWHWQGPVEHVPDLLHFPLPIRRRPLASGRLASKDEIQGTIKILYVSPVGGLAKELLPAMLNAFQNAGADCLLLLYDEAELILPPNVRVIRDGGYKWQLAIQHLHPNTIAIYDFIFFWDDDIEMDGFDPVRFVKIMQENRLEMAQPSIQSRHGLSHGITRHRACPLPVRDPDRLTMHRVVGRLTNFVEIMVPVFTRDAWREFYSYLEPGNRSGWGYDYIPLGRKGIVDALPVEHTRPVQSINGKSENDIRRFLDDQGLFRHPPVDQGWLFEKMKANSNL